LAGMTPYPGQEWMEQQARNATMEEWGFLRGCRYLLHDRDTKFCASFRELIKSGSIKTIRLPARSPNLNSFAERWVRSVKEECLSRLILFGESSLRRALQQYIVHYHEERNHQGKENLILFPLKREGERDRKAAVRCRERLGGLLKSLRARGRVGVEVGTACHVWQSHIYKDIRMRAVWPDEFFDQTGSERIVDCEPRPSDSRGPWKSTSSTN
jgi:hypothetical protein